MNNEVKLSFWEILFSPFISMKNMVTSKSDVDGGNLDPKDPIGAELLESLYKIGNKVKMKNFGGSGQVLSHEESEVDCT